MLFCLLVPERKEFERDEVSGREQEISGFEKESEGRRKGAKRRLDGGDERQGCDAGTTMKKNGREHGDEKDDGRREPDNFKPLLAALSPD